jgi:hypothetical protein
MSDLSGPDCGIGGYDLFGSSVWSAGRWRYRVELHGCRRDWAHSSGADGKLMSLQSLQAVNMRAGLSAHGTLIEYQKPGMETFTLSAIRCRRNSDEAGQVGCFDELLVALSDFSIPPMKGDIAILDGYQYAVTDIRNPVPDGTAYLVLAKRPGQQPC